LTLCHAELSRLLELDLTEFWDDETDAERTDETGAGLVCMPTGASYARGPPCRREYAPFTERWCSTAIDLMEPRAERMEDEVDETEVFRGADILIWVVCLIFGCWLSGMVLVVVMVSLYDKAEA
jgi:hypothetical protein